MTDDFRKVYCDVCEQKIYLNDFPSNWDEMESEERYAYMTNQCKCDNPNVEEHAGLAGWKNTGGPVEDWVLLCRRCGKCD